MWSYGHQFDQDQLCDNRYQTERTVPPLPPYLVLNGARIDQVSEHRLLGLTIDNKLRWDSHNNNVCKTVSRRAFRLSELRYIVDIDTRKLFFSAHIKPHIDYASVVWDGCSYVLIKRINSPQRRPVKLVFPDTTLTIDQKLKETRIMIIQNHRALTMRPQSTYLTCTHALLTLFQLQELSEGSREDWAELYGCIK